MPAYDGYIVKDKNSSNVYFGSDSDDSSSIKISQILQINTVSSAGITALSLTLGGTPLDGNTTAYSYYNNSDNTGHDEGYVIFYDVSSSAETITGFFLDGTEYKIGGDEAAWGNISGTLSDQTDLQTALNAKANSTDILTKTNTTAFTPTGNYNPATKKYVDDNKTEYDAGEGIIIGSINSDMQGPAPDGFHVPLNTEWQAVYDIWTALGGGSKDGTNFGIALKLPFTGFRDGYSVGVSNQGTVGYYWSSSRKAADWANYLSLSSTLIGPQYSNSRANGFSIRCFKNSPTVPTSSWTKIYGTSIEAGGIFGSSTDGLISLSSDGQTWITIMDKNLGATTVWNSLDTLSEANCGKYYQWGNNYGFPRTGSVTTSNKQVNASTYGPGNYYSSDTFIKQSGRWDTTDNGNLWGGVTQGTWIGEGNTIVNTGVLSVNGQTGDVTVASPDMSNYLAKDNTTSFTPSGDYNPATKKYVDDIASGKQDTLISGTNIKTVNNQSLLGSGNITIESGGIQNDTTGTTTTVTKIRAGTEAEYALITHNVGTIYYIF